MRPTRALVTTALSAGTLALGVMVAPPAGASTDDDSSAGGTTTVVLDPDLVPVLVEDLGVETLGDAELSAPDGAAQVSFPITEIEGDGEIEHSGGLAFTTLDGGSLEIREFEISVDEAILEAEATLDGEELDGEVDVFNLVEAEAIDGAVPSCDGVQAGLTLTAAAAEALGAPDFADVFVGDACVVPES
ncbi:hypothetical protein OF117_07225 [Geodermatophilus sp. YIM 151500]|uniref:hypothetical protein n=1 Tax=Geodermatophilus sp. YIM 151500 TaxID=2984531 RepID=UPI0021E4161D|nr:hypothetical protein [Geodermatophilus sp. YIM 151500]MCV2489152.1 hypothetical protein [Geodermatophilus sp. YIM 151500]